MQKIEKNLKCKNKLKYITKKDLKLKRERTALCFFFCLFNLFIYLFFFAFAIFLLLCFFSFFGNIFIYLLFIFYSFFVCVCFFLSGFALRGYRTKKV